MVLAGVYPRRAVNRTALLALALSISSVSCHRRRAHRRARTAPPAGWHVAPITAPSMRVRDGYTLHGAVRAENGRAAPAPHPLAPIVATARLEDGSWRFAAADGSLYRAASYTAPLAPMGALPFALEAPLARESAALQGAHSEGALIVRGRDLSAHRVDGEGQLRRLPLQGVIAALSVDPQTLLALTEPGTLSLSLDGGATFEPLRPPAGVALSLWINEDGARVRTTAGTLRYLRGTLVDDGTGLTAARSLAVPEGVSERLQRSMFQSPWPLAPGESASHDGRVVFTLRGDRFVTLRARDGVERASEAAPGERCALSPTRDGVGAVCTRGWAKVVLSRRASERGWHILRDERDAQPIGEVRFDTRSAMWVSAAPCTQRREPLDALCITDEHGVSREVTLQGELVGVHDRRVFVRTAGFLRVLDARGEELSRAPYLIAAPEGFDARALREGVALVPRGPHAQQGWIYSRDRWSAVRLPGRYARVTDDGAWITWTHDASTLQQSLDGRRFEAMPSPVRGDARALALEDEALQCVAGWCALGTRLVLAPGLLAGAALGRSDLLVAQPDRRAQRTLRCEHGAVSAAQEIDHGAASTGYAVRAEVSAPDSLTMVWEGDRVRGRATVAVPSREGAVMELRGVPFATSPMALVTRCDARGCDHLLIAGGRVTDLRLGRAVPGGVEAHQWENGVMIRVDDVRPEGSLVTLLHVDAQGALRRRRSYALAGRIEDAAAGRWRSRDGLWIASLTGQMRFHPLDGIDDVAVILRAPDERTGPCARGAVFEGEARWVHSVPVVRGEGWFLERGRWQHEEILGLSEGATCVRQLGAGEPHEESEARGTREERVAVRSFVLRAEGDGYVGEAWSERRRIALRCNAME